MWARDTRKTHRRRGSLARVVCALIVLASGRAATATDLEFLPVDASDEALHAEQRALVDTLARRHVGSPLTGGPPDLRLLQAILDRGLVESGQTFELQALGVVLGDVMRNQLPLEWVVVRDEAGRSRALRYKQTRNVFFPVTMISRRVQRDAPVDVRALYEKVASRVEALEHPPRRGSALP